MPKIENTFSTFVIAVLIAGGLLFSSLDGNNRQKADYPLLVGNSVNAQNANGASRPRWAASATGRVEPQSGAVNVASLVGGRITNVAVAIGDLVAKGDVLVQLDDEEALQRIVAARAEADVRKLERADEEVTGLALERREAEDEVAAARRERFAAWRALDDTVELKRSGEARESDVTAAREAVDKSEQRLKDALAELVRVNAQEDLPLPGRLDTSLTIARADLALAEEAFEKTRIRAPFEGSVLNVFARIGETAAPGPEAPLVVFGDLSKMRVRAEVEERDVAKVQVGQKVVVKADAFPDQQFDGVVKEISGALGSPRIASRGPRRPNDVDVLEVIVELDGVPPLLTGMRVDVFFHRQEAEARKSASLASKV
ncbi:MAG: efflux RND transporter periplasmic adaptor subunit [Alphaproteobacteria bacterium]|nr:efflux RND transporter periplasmic adaptor subunit [Alphaproteobacteria bacterium]